MGRFRHIGSEVWLQVDRDELQLLSQSVSEYITLIDDGRPVGPQPHELSEDDPFAAWERSFGQEPSIEDEHLDDERDPVTERLFPPAYIDDPEAASDYRRFTEPEQRAAKLSAAQVVLDDLGKVSRGEVRIRQEHIDAWLKTLNSLRLVLSVMLGITDEITSHDVAERPDEDPRAWLHTFYSWLGWMLESLLECVLPE
ncbi:DUF2017 domain-containing protein [Aestuariimicrobium sp. p3-SID1156]|uniref:DUF2017 domain-containing protein n=1 Tax=Aestuariimicrobium sp. p3-SID1156 TaxID=2916038 RepID=UPI00223B3439|nr:DUF2017 domain-containing protein [Aestuariimicrobium sp. p3-SID1156]MCT1459981.1 DUF2017 domain-containing protein [Aestuariimicrobium sp. p3-SID1156]